MTPGGRGSMSSVDRPAPGDASDWRSRVIERSLARSAASVRARGIGPASRVVAAAIEISKETGRTTFSIQEVVERADVAVQTFYRYFGSKDALHLAMLEETIRSRTTIVSASIEEIDDPIERLRAIVTDPFVQFEEVGSGMPSVVVREHYRLLELFPAEMERTVGLYTDLVSSALGAAHRAGLVSSTDIGADADLITHVVLSMYHRLRLGAVDDARAAGEHCWDFCRRAVLATERGPAGGRARQAGARPGRARAGTTDRTDRRGRPGRG